MGRAPCCEKVGLKRGRWTAAEDDILTKYIQTNGEGSWRSLPKNAGLLRCGKSCRLRWVNYLKGDLKRGNISADEEKIIINLHATLGNRWSLIASHLPGRTDNEIKNYWNSHLSRKIDTFRRPANESIESLLDMSKVTIPPKKKGGRTSRWAMKKNRANNVVTQQNVLGTAKKPAAMSKSPGLDLSPGGKDKGEGKKDLVLPNHFQNSEIRMSDSTNGGESDSSVEILGPLDGFCEEMLFDGINDMVDNGDSLELDGPRDSGATWALTIGAQTASNDVPSPSNHNLATESGSHEDGNVSPNCTGGLCCSSSVASFVEDGSVNWDYLEGFLQGNDNEDSLPLVDEGDEVLSWLWMSDDVEGKNLREVGFDERQEAMVSWLLS